MKIKLSEFARSKSYALLLDLIRDGIVVNNACKYGNDQPKNLKIVLNTYNYHDLASRVSKNGIFIECLVDQWEVAGKNREDVVEELYLRGVK